MKCNIVKVVNQNNGWFWKMSQVCLDFRNQTGSNECFECSSCSSVRAFERSSVFAPPKAQRSFWARNKGAQGGRQRGVSPKKKVRVKGAALVGTGVQAH